MQHWKELVTIIITPHNRPEYLARTLDYLKSSGLKILICDSSDAAYKGALSEGIYYRHVKHEHFVSKVYAILSLVKTKYVMLYAEDDFYALHGIERCVEFLEGHNDYSSCQGMYARFWNQGGATKYKHTYKISFRKDISGNTSGERAKQLLKNYFQLFYALHRKEHLLQMFEFAKEHEILNLFAVEMMIALSAIGAGKHKVLTVFFGAREVIPTSVGHQKDNFEVFVIDKRYRNQRAALDSFISNVYLPYESNQLYNLYFGQLWQKRSRVKRIWLKLKFSIIGGIGFCDPLFSSTIIEMMSYVEKHRKSIEHPSSL